MTLTVTTHQAEEDLRNESIKIFVNGDVIKKSDAKVSVFDSGFMLGDGVWEGLRLYDRQWVFFDEHMERLFSAAKAIDLNIDHDAEGILNALEKTRLSNNIETDAHARIMITRGVKIRPFQHPSLSQSGPTFVIIIEHSKPQIARPIKLATVPHIRGLPMSQDPKLNSHSKLNCVLACIAAEKAGADEALMLDVNGFVSTCNSTNFFMIKDGVVYTSTGQYCMNGITRQKIIDVCKANNIEVREVNFSLFDVYGADEAFVTGTFAGVTPVISIDGKTIGDASNNEMSATLEKYYKTLVETQIK